MTASIADNPNNTYGYGIIDATEVFKIIGPALALVDPQAYPVSYNVLKTYPNPFNPAINIEITAVEELITDVSIISFSGQYVQKIFSQEKFSTQHKLFHGNPTIFQVEYI